MNPEKPLIKFISVGGGIWLALFLLIYGGLVLLDLAAKFAYFYLEDGKTEKGLEAVKMSMRLFRRNWLRIISIHVCYYTLAYTVEILTCGLALIFFMPSAYAADMMVYDALENGILPDQQPQPRIDAGSSGL